MSYRKRWHIPQWNYMTHTTPMLSPLLNWSKPSLTSSQRRTTQAKCVHVCMCMWCECAMCVCTYQCPLVQWGCHGCSSFAGAHIGIVILDTGFTSAHIGLMHCYMVFLIQALIVHTLDWCIVAVDTGGKTCKRKTPLCEREMTYRPSDLIIPTTTHLILCTLSALH